MALRFILSALSISVAVTCSAQCISLMDMRSLLNRHIEPGDKFLAQIDFVSLTGKRGPKQLWGHVKNSGLLTTLQDSPDSTVSTVIFRPVLNTKCYNLLVKDVVAAGFSEQQVIRERDDKFSFYSSADYGVIIRKSTNVSAIYLMTKARYEKALRREVPL